jgi:plastocyanin
MTRRRMVIGATLAAVVLLAAGCGGGSGGSSSGSSGGGEDRTVLIDYKHDQFASSFLHYYPEKVTVRPGDKVTFRQSWTGEPHSVTMGKVVDDAFELAPLVKDYNNADEARAGGLDEPTIARAVATFSKLPSMTNDGFEIYQPGAQPCFVAAYDDVPNFSDAGDNQDPKVPCPTKGKPQPAFTGRQALYSSGFIPYQGAKGNSFELPIAADATPGTYQYFCNYHYFEMHGTVEVVAKDAAIPSADAVRREGQKEIARDAKSALGPVHDAQAGSFGDAKPPLVGLATATEHDLVAVDGFFPSAVTAEVGKPVTWTDAGWTHTISFNVPKYFPIFTVAKSGDVKWDPKSYESVGWKVAPAAGGSGPDDPPPPRSIDVGEWNGGGGFHSSGMLVPGDTFTVTFTRPGTYPFACVLHPAMVGKVTVRA